MKIIIPVLQRQDKKRLSDFLKMTLLANENPEI